MQSADSTKCVTRSPNHHLPFAEGLAALHKPCERLWNIVTSTTPTFLFAFVSIVGRAHGAVTLPLRVCDSLVCNGLMFGFNHRRCVP